MSRLYEKFKTEIEDENKKTIEVSSADFKDLLDDPATIFGPLKPKPPISKVIDETKYQKVRTGLFSWQMQKIHEHKEYHYDYQDKEYLEKMASYKGQSLNVNELYFHGKRVILKDQNNVDITI